MAVKKLRTSLAVSADVQREMDLLGSFVKEALAPPRDSVSLHNLMTMISERTGALRVSVVQILGDQKAMVLAASDDSLITGKILDLFKYPEIQLVARQKEPHFIEEASRAPLLDPVRDDFNKTPYESLALFPVYEQGRFFGVMSLRLPRTNKDDMSFIKSYGGFCSDIISLTIGIQA